MLRNHPDDRSRHNMWDGRLDSIQHVVPKFGREPILQQPAQHTRNDSITPGLRPPADNSNRPSGASAIDRITAIILQPRTGGPQNKLKLSDIGLWHAKNDSLNRVSKISSSRQAG